MRVNPWWCCAALVAILIAFGNELAVPNPVLADSDEQVNDPDGRECVRHPAHCPDLAVTFQTVPDPIPLNMAQTVLVTVTNLASTRLARIPKGTDVLKLTLSQQLTYDAFTAPPNFECTPAGAPVTTIECHATRRTTLPAGQKLTFALTFTNTGPTSALSLTAVVDPAQEIPDANRANNTASAATTVGGLTYPTSGYFLDCDRSLSGELRGTKVACEGFMQAPPVPPFAGGQWLLTTAAGLGFEFPQGLQVDTLVPSQGFTCNTSAGFVCTASAPIALSPKQVVEVFSVTGTVVGFPLGGGNLGIDISFCEVGVPWGGGCIGIGGSVGE